MFNLDKKIKTKKKKSWTFKASNISKFFDEHVKKSVPFYGFSHEIALGLSDFFIKNNSFCNDLGCSTGSLLRKIKDRHSDKKINLIGYDDSKHMINFAKKKNKNIKFINKDISKINIRKSDFILSLYTIQFIQPKKRQEIFDKIYRSLNWGGGFFLCEKIRGKDARFQDILNFLYFDFKKKQDLTYEEILNKEQSLRGVMEPFTIDANIGFLKRAGFKDIMPVYQYLCFVGILAIK
jgi:tRNA (cmo5U34)-methyltransferase